MSRCPCPCPVLPPGEVVGAVGSRLGPAPSLPVLCRGPARPARPAPPLHAGSAGATRGPTSGPLPDRACVAFRWGRCRATRGSTWRSRTTLRASSTSSTRRRPSPRTGSRPTARVSPGPAAGALPAPLWVGAERPLCWSGKPRVSCGPRGCNRSRQEQKEPSFPSENSKSLDSQAGCSISCYIRFLPLLETAVLIEPRLYLWVFFRFCSVRSKVHATPVAFVSKFFVIVSFLRSQNQGSEIGVLSLLQNFRKKLLTVWK